MKLTILGTGHAMATECFNTCFAISNNPHEYMLVDSGGGNGIIKQLKKADIPLEEIVAIFISHAHMDHILGAVWIIRRLVTKYYKGECERPIYIYGNDEVISCLKTLCDALIPEFFKHLIGDKITFEKVDNLEHKEIIGMDFEFFDLNAQKNKQYGFSAILEGKRKFTFIGDEAYQKESEKFITGSEWLFTDAYMAGEYADIYNPMEKHHHSSVRYVSEMAERLNVKNLILSHTKDDDMANRRALFTEDAKKYYSGKVFVPDDLETIDIM